jgi:hypothetical protein
LVTSLLAATALPSSCGFISHAGVPGHFREHLVEELARPRSSKQVRCVDLLVAAGEASINRKRSANPCGLVSASRPAGGSEIGNFW